MCEKRHTLIKGGKKMKATAKKVFLCCIILWTAMLMPYFIPQLNKLDPVIIGLPFTIFWQYMIILLHLILCVFSSKYVWDDFNGGENER